jgi:hypothetical protein
LKLLCQARQGEVLIYEKFNQPFARIYLFAVHSRGPLYCFEARRRLEGRNFYAKPIILADKSKGEKDEN